MLITESALQIPHLTQTIDWMVSHVLACGENIWLGRAS
jgi:hypothetical protein